MKQIIIIIAIVLSQMQSQWQTIDTSYSFEPALIKKMQIIKKTDSIIKKDVLICVHKDPKDSLYLDITISKKGRVCEEGKYKLNSIHIAYVTVYSMDGNSEKKPSRVTFQYIREGYWQFIKRNGIESVYYLNGKRLKMKI